MKKMMFEKMENPKMKRKEELREDAQKVKAVKSIAKAEVKGHEKRMHKTKMAAGGTVDSTPRGTGAAVKGITPLRKNG